MSALPPQIEDVLEAFRASDAVLDIAEPRQFDDGAFVIEARFNTQLPSRWAKAGESPDGVRSSEIVTTYFPVDYPNQAPHFRLRADFNSKLPHINPHRPGDPVPPCILAGKTLELLHSEGLFSLVNQMAEWLKNAGRQSLINLAQGWEPMRRDDLRNLMFFDPEVELLSSKTFGKHQLFAVNCWWTEKTNTSLASGQCRWPSATIQAQQLQKIFRRQFLSEETIEGQSLMAVCWPSATETGQPVVIDQYLPDTLSCVGELATRATELGCNKSLDSFASNLNYILKQFKPGFKHPIFIILPVRRPAKVIGFSSEYEFLCYRVDITTPAALSDETCPVSAVAFLVPTSKELLRRTSGISSDTDTLDISYLGCGSLGSKLALHSARAGFPPALLIDSEELAPHNVARHALFPRHCMLRTKARVLAEEIETFQLKKPKVFNGNIVGANLHKDPLKNAFFGDGKMLVNTTGSHAVRQWLTNNAFTARVMESCLTNRGEVGILLLEGRERNPNCADLMCIAYDVLRKNNCLAPPLAPGESLLQVGVGCNSVTLPMSDACISLFAAGMSQFLLGAQVRALLDEGLVSVGLLGADRMSVGWQHLRVGETHLAEASGLPGWKVRVLDTAHRKIMEDVGCHPGVESGGLIVGRCSPTHREVTIVDVLAAPPDSSRSPTKFVLGVEGLAGAIMTYDKGGSDVLWCLGTWHSHLQPSGPSCIDRATAKSVEGLLRGAVVMLIRHPGGYAAIVGAGWIQ